ncbi:hypothetical protein BTHI11S_02856 [Bosea thiooxidans]
MKDWLLQIFTWWNGQTIGTRFHTWRFGEKVGEDEFGNVYYRTKGGVKDKALGFQRRWVIYKGEAEASKVPPGWNGWLHHTVDVAPSEENYQPREWQQPHQQNWTGTALAYRPQGSTLAEGERPAATGDYQAWTRGAERRRRPNQRFPMKRAALKGAALFMSSAMARRNLIPAAAAVP